MKPNRQHRLSVPRTQSQPSHPHGKRCDTSRCSDVFWCPWKLPQQCHCCVPHAFIMLTSILGGRTGWEGAQCVVRSRVATHIADLALWESPPTTCAPPQLLLAAFRRRIERSREGFETQQCPRAATPRAQNVDIFWWDAGFVPHSCFALVP